MKALFILAVAAISSGNLHAGLATLVVGNGTNTVSSIEVKTLESAELVSFPIAFTNPAYDTRVQVIKDGVTFTYRPHAWIAGPDGVPVSKTPLEPLIVTGPATIRLVTTSADGKALCTFRINPEAYPPDESAIVMPGTNGGARVTLEASTDLTTWAPATNGVYTNLRAAKFFRIAVERVQ